MSVKLVFTIPDVNTAHSVVSALKGAGVSEEGISVVGNEATALDELPDSGEYANDVVPGAIRGAGFGGATGLLAGLAAGIVAPGLVAGGAALAVLAAGGASFGVLASTLVGSSVPNSEIREYEESLERGELLFVVEVDEDKEQAVRQLLESEFAKIDYEGKIDLVPPVV